MIIAAALVGGKISSSGSNKDASDSCSSNRSCGRNDDCCGTGWWEDQHSRQQHGCE
jgi:hypothetical protein